MIVRLLLLSLLSFLLFCRAGSDPSPGVTPFDGQSAFGYLQAQCALGPRVPNTEAHLKALVMLTRFFDSLNIHCDRHDFAVKDPYADDTLHLTNLLARLNPEKKNRFLLCAHWDSRPRSEEDSDPAKRNSPLPGANDGASAVAVLMQLLRQLSTAKVDQGIDCLFVDGEDWGKPGDIDYYCLGSKEFARHVKAGDYVYAVVLDMVGDKDQSFSKEGYSVRYQPKLVDKIWERASRLGMSQQFNTGVTEPIYDDHVPLLASSLKVVDIIDFQYPWWHTTGDTPDKCSPESLGRVGKLLMSLAVDPL